METHVEIMARIRADSESYARRKACEHYRFVRVGLAYVAGDRIAPIFACDKGCGETTWITFCGKVQ